jgi:hypothetical protein
MRHAIYEGDRDKDNIAERIENFALKTTPAKAAAVIIRRGIQARSGRILIGRDAYLVFWLHRFFPRGTVKFMKRISLFLFQKKKDIPGNKDLSKAS